MRARFSVFRDFLFPPITRVVKKPSPGKKVAGGVNDRPREIVEFTNENVTRRVHTFTLPCEWGERRKSHRCAGINKGKREGLQFRGCDRRVKTRQWKSAGAEAFMPVETSHCPLQMSRPHGVERGGGGGLARAVWYSTSMYARRDNDDDVIIAS